MQDNIVLLAELVRLKKYELYRKDPLKWAEDVLGDDPAMFEWTRHGKQYDTHEWDGTKNPLSTAWYALANKKWACVTAATGTSKTYTAAKIALWFLDVYEDSLVVTTAPKESQLTMNLWGEISKLMPRFKQVRPNCYMTKLNLKPEGLNANSPYQKSHQMVGFVAGVGAEEDSATKAQGFHRKNMLFIMEEMAGMSPAIVTAFKETCTSENNLILALGNPDSEYDELYKFSKLPSVVDIRISAYDFPNVVLDEDIYFGAVTRASIERRRLEHGEDAPIFKSRVRGITPKNDQNSLIKSDWIDAAWKYGQHWSNIEEVEGFNSCGVDVAQSENNDRAAICFFKGNTIVRIDDFICNNATHLAYNIMFDNAELVDRDYQNYNTGKARDYDIMPQCIGVDVVGVGVATINAFRDFGFDAQPLSGGAWQEAIPTEYIEGVGEKPMYKFQNLRAQMYYELREDFRKGNIIIGTEDAALFEQMKRELCSIRYGQSENAIAVEKKESLRKRLGGKSPNIADAIAYANFMRKAYRFGGFDAPFLF